MSNALLRAAISCFLCLMGSTLFAVKADADAFAYAVDAGENLYSIDQTTAQSTLIGHTGQFLEGIALSASGNLYGTNLSGQLFQIDRFTGNATFAGNTIGRNVEGIFFNGNQLCGLDTSARPTMFHIDSHSGAVSEWQTVSQITGTVRAAARFDNSNALIRTDGSSNDFTTSVLKKLNLNTGLSRSSRLLACI